MKKKWEKPEFVILSRTTPEEAVLLSCKWDIPPTGGPGKLFGMCYVWTTTEAVPCETISLS